MVDICKFVNKHKKDYIGKPVYSLFELMKDLDVYQSMDFGDDTYDVLCGWEIEVYERDDGYSMYDPCLRKLCKHINLVYVPESSAIGNVVVDTTKFCMENFSWLYKLMKTYVGGIFDEDHNFDPDTVDFDSIDVDEELDDVLYYMVKEIHEDVFVGNETESFYDMLNHYLDEAYKEE